MRTKRQNRRNGCAELLARSSGTLLRRIKLPVVLSSALLYSQLAVLAQDLRASSTASWYGEKHRGRLMANGKKFNPDRFTAASWFYPLGTKVRVISSARDRRSVVVTITDRGPALELVRSGRKIDLSHAAFKQLSIPARGLVAVRIEPIRSERGVYDASE